MENKKITAMVGMFVAIGSILIFIITFLLGQENSLFESTTRLYIAFEDVGGLKPGSQVRLAGVNIGIVRNIEFAPVLDDKKLHVEIQVRNAMMPRIREDSIATIGSKGLLGDKVIEISIGSGEKPPLKENSYVQSEEPTDMFKILEEGGALISHGADVAKDLKKAIREIATEDTINHVKGVIESLDNIFNEVETGDGVVHGLVYDKSVQVDVKAIVNNVRTATVKLNRSVEHVEDILNEVRNGQGTVHGLIYDSDGKKIVENLRAASGTISELVTAIKDGNGMLHTLIYEEDKENIIRNLEDATFNIKKMASYIESGKGTIGGLIKDPSVYEDLKLVLGNLKRNAALKTLIRLSLEKGEEKGLEGSNEPVKDPENKEE